MGEEHLRRRRDLSSHEFRKLRSSRDWRRVVNGVLIDASTDPGEGAMHLHRLRATVDRMGDAVASHQSAAALYDVPVWNVSLRAVHVTKNRSTGARRTRDVVVHAAPIVGPVAVVGNLLVTLPARTIVDCARSLTFEQAVVIGDALCRKFRVTREEMLHELTVARTRTGIAQARRVVTFIDGHSESVGESLSRITLVRNGIEGLLPQGEVFAETGEFLGRADFFHKDRPVVGEFDGDGKYDGPDGRRVLLNEKKRENLLRDHGNEVVRWGWSVALDGSPLIEQFARAHRRVNPHAPRQSWIRQARLPGATELTIRFDWQ